MVGALSLYWFLVTLLSDFPSVFSAQSLAALPPLAAALLEATASFFAPRVLIFVLPAILGVALALYGGAQYLADLYELETPAIAWRYLLGAVFGLWYPTLSVQSGDLESLDHRNPLLRIGGPGYLILHLGFAAVFETPTGQPRVYGPSRRNPQAQPVFIPGFERLREVIDLRDQLRQLDQVPAVTKDGIEVFARDVQVVFRVSAGERRSLQQPYHLAASSAWCGQVCGQNGALHHLLPTAPRAGPVLQPVARWRSSWRPAARPYHLRPEFTHPGHIPPPARRFHPSCRLRSWVWAGLGGGGHVKCGTIRFGPSHRGGGRSLHLPPCDQVQAEAAAPEHLSRAAVGGTGHSGDGRRPGLDAGQQQAVPLLWSGAKRRLMDLEACLEEEARNEDQPQLAQAIPHLSLMIGPHSDQVILG
jgi:hypothetical protein